MNTQTGAQNLNFQLVTGLEIHVQLNTKSKIFSSDSATFGAQPNQHISTVSLALPGALPKLNKAVIAKAIRIGLALNCTINPLHFFDRKHYFYADLPKGYQITQDNSPICTHGYLDITLANGEEKRIRINRIHLEEDAGKSLHDQDPNYSYVDLNRAGVPLIEIVTEPDLSSAEEASVLLTEIRKLVRYLNVSDGNMEEGSLRCDANISIQKIGDQKYGTRCEVKNLNSMRNVRRAIDFEFNRQVNLLNKGEKVIQSTLNFDAEKGTTTPMRSKEEANDYRYFPDPDLPPILIGEEWLAEIKLAMPVLPAQRIKTFMEEYEISKAEATLLVLDTDLCAYFNAAKATVNQQKSLINWLLGPIRAWLTEQKITIANFNIAPAQLAVAINLVDDKKINQQSVLRQLFPAITAQTDVLALATQLNLLIVAENNDILMYIDEVLQRYQPQVQAYKMGKKGVLGLFVGEVMKLAKGKADAKKINELLIEKLK